MVGLVLTFVVFAAGLPLTRALAQTETPLPYIPVVTATPNPDGSIWHIVKSGQTLIFIAAAYGVTVEQIKTLNSLTSNVIHIGQKLLIRPAYTPTLTPTITETPLPPTPTAIPPTATPITFTPTSTWTQTASPEASATPTLRVATVAQSTKASTSGLLFFGGTILVLLEITFLVGRILLTRSATRDSHCPRCGNDAFLPMHLSILERILGFRMHLGRFRCQNPDCGWAGLRRFD